MKRIKDIRSTIRNSLVPESIAQQIALSGRKAWDQIWEKMYFEDWNVPAPKLRFPNLKPNR